MATTQNTFNGDGSNLGPFSFTFKWLESTDIKVSVGGVLKTAGTHYNLQNLNYNPLTGKTGGEVLFTAGNAPPVGTNNIRIYRDTDDEALSAVFSSGSAIRAKDLNDNFTQNLYVTQEISNNSLNIDGSNYMVGNLNLNNFKVINSTAPSSGADLANKTYVDDRVSTSAVAGSPYFLQDGAGAVNRSWSSKLKEVVSVKDFIPEGTDTANTDCTAYIQAAVTAAKHIVFPAGTYSINNAITISQAGTTVEGLGDVEILQQAYPQHVFFISASNCSVKGLKFTGVPTKTLLSETLATRYYGDTQRAKSSAVYCYGIDNVDLVDCQFKNFITGIFFKGGDDISWVTNDGQGSRMTASTFVLNAADSQANDYWNGAYIRILTNNGSYGPARISDYDSATNTVTFTTATTPITLTGSNQWNYILIAGRSKNLVVRDCYFDLIDFGINGASVENLSIEGCIYTTIEQTQQTNVRPHSIYLTGGDNRNVRASSLMTYSCVAGQAYKFVGVDGLFLSDLDSYDSRGAATIEGCRNVTGDNLTSLLSGRTNEFQPGIVDLTASEKVYLTNLKLSLHPNYNLTASDFRPYGVSITGSDDIDRGDIGTMLAVSPLQVSEIYTANVVVDAGVNYTGTVRSYVVLGTATRPVIDSTFDGALLVDGDNCAYQPFRADYCSNIKFRNPSFDTTPISAINQLDANSSNCTILLLPDKTGFTLTNTGTNNKLIYSTPFTRGTWTPTIVGSTVAGTNTYATQIGDWMKIGDLVYVTGRITLTNLASTGNINIAGLPFAADTLDASTGAGYFQGGGFGEYSNVTFTAVPALRITNNATDMQVVFPGTSSVTRATNTVFSNTSSMTFSFSYKALPSLL